MKLYKTIPIFLSVFFGMAIFSIAATIWEENFYKQVTIWIDINKLMPCLDKFENLFIRFG